MKVVPLFETFRSALQVQQSEIDDLLKRQKQELAIFKNKKNHEFRNRALEKQHEKNDEFLFNAKKIVTSLQKQQVEKAKKYADVLLDGIERQRTERIL